MIPIKWCLWTHHQSNDEFMTNNTVFIIMVYTFHLQTIFFVELYPPETRKLLERLVNYVIYKVNFFICNFFKNIFWSFLLVACTYLNMWDITFSGTCFWDPNFPMNLYRIMYGDICGGAYLKICVKYHTIIHKKFITAEVLRKSHIMTLKFICNS